MPVTTLLQTFSGGSTMNMPRHTILRHIALVVAFLCFLRAAVNAAPVVTKTKSVRALSPQDQNNAQTLDTHWIDMFDNLQPLPTPQTSEARSAPSTESLRTHQEQNYFYAIGNERHRPITSSLPRDKFPWREEISGFHGPFAQFITHRYGTDSNVTNHYMRGFCCGLASTGAVMMVLAGLCLVGRVWRGCGADE